jgi:hypothetical protein
VAGTRKRFAGGFPYLACQSGEQSSIGFQPVSSVDYGWLAFLSGPTISDCLDEKSKSVGGSIQAAVFRGETHIMERCTHIQQLRIEFFFISSFRPRTGCPVSPIRASEGISSGISLRPRITSVLRQSASVELLITSTWRTDDFIGLVH